jgi:hypothetical protein
MKTAILKLLLRRYRRIQPSLILTDGKRVMRVRLKGINSIRKKLATGEFVTYYYAWKGGPRLQGELGTPEFMRSYNEAVARKATPTRGTLLSLLQQYQASEDFHALANSTRRSYIALIERIEKSFWRLPSFRTDGPPFTWNLHGMAR